MNNSVNIVNRKVKFEYTFIDKYIAGIQLVGTEIKPIRNGKISMVDSFCVFNKEGELFVNNIVITEDNGSYTHETNRQRKLLLKKKELIKLNKDLINGLTIVPYRIFSNERGRFKVEIVLAKGKKLYDKRETIKKRDLDREMKK
jgi:SsrA-binding protein